MRDHKSLEAWREAHRVVIGVLNFCATNWRPHARAVFDQLQRAALSVQLNIAEGYAFRSRSRFRAHLDIAYGSAVETGELLELMQLRELVPPEAIKPILSSCLRSQLLLLGLIKRYRASQIV